MSCQRTGSSVRLTGVAACMRCAVHAMEGPQGRRNPFFRALNLFKYRPTLNRFRQAVLGACCAWCMLLRDGAACACASASACGRTLTSHWWCWPNNVFRSLFTVQGEGLHFQRKPYTAVFYILVRSALRAPRSAAALPTVRVCKRCRGSVRQVCLPCRPCQARDETARQLW